MLYLDLGGAAAGARRRWFWSARRTALARWHRADHLGDPAEPLDQTQSASLVASRSAAVVPRARSACSRTALPRLRLQPGQLLLLLRRGGPRARGDRRRDQQHAVGRAALLRAAGEPQRSGTPAKLRFRFGKDFHVSPFLPMDMDYDWRFSRARRAACWCTWRTGARTRPVFDATLRSTASRSGRGALAGALAALPAADRSGRRPRSTGRRCGCGSSATPFHTHPDKTGAGHRHVEGRIERLAP